MTTTKHGKEMKKIGKIIKSIAEYLWDGIMLVFMIMFGFLYLAFAFVKNLFAKKNKDL